MSVEWHKLGGLIAQTENRNTDLRFGIEDVRGMTITKEVIQTKANLSGNDLSKFQIVEPGAFIYNPRTHGKKIGLGYNATGKPFLISWNNIAFNVQDKAIVEPLYLYLYFCRDEWDREACFQSWGSSTEVFSWRALCEMQIPVPPIAEQRKAVEAWQGLRKMKEENEQLAEPLLALCRSYLQEIKKKYPMKEIGPMIEEQSERNEGMRLVAQDVRGLSTNKEIIPTAANLSGVNLSSYKLVRNRQFAYVSDTSRRGDKVSLGYNKDSADYLVSSISTVFSTRENVLNSEFLYLWFCRPEFDRYARFHSWGSARETFNWADMCRVKIPVPPIEVQRAVVDLYRCANEAKKIAAEADKLSREICPALIQQVVARPRTGERDGGAGRKAGECDGNEGRARRKAASAAATAAGR